MNAIQAPKAPVRLMFPPLLVLAKREHASTNVLPVVTMLHAVSPRALGKRVHVSRMIGIKVMEKAKMVLVVTIAMIAGIHVMEIFATNQRFLKICIHADYCYRYSTCFLKTDNISVA